MKMWYSSKSLCIISILNRFKYFDQNNQTIFIQKSVNTIRPKYDPGGKRFNTPPMLYTTFILIHFVVSGPRELDFFSLIYFLSCKIRNLSTAKKDYWHSQVMCFAINFHCFLCCDTKYFNKSTLFFLITKAAKTKFHSCSFTY